MVQWPEVVREVVGQGHELGNHSMSHTRFSWLSVRARRLEMAFADRLLLEAGEQELPPFRLPYAEDSLLLLGFCLLEGRRLALWSRDSLDYRLSAGEVLVHFEETPIVAGDVLLFHDDGPAAVDSLAVLIPKWRSEGFSFGRLSQISP